MTVLTSLPSSDLDVQRYDLGARLAYANPAPRSAVPGYGVPQSGLRLADDAAFYGNGHTIYCSDGSAGDSAIICLWRSSQDRASESTLIDGLRFGYGRYGIMTPWSADRPGNYTVAQWYQRGGHIVRNVWGTAYAKGIRIAARETLVEDFNIWGVGGSTGENARAIGITMLGPQPVVRRGFVRRMVHIPSSAPEAVGISFEGDCDGGLIEDVEIGNQSLLPHLSIGIWLGSSHGVQVRRARISNMQYALDCSDASGVVEDVDTFNCEFGLAHIANDPRFKLRRCFDHKLVEGEWQTTDVSNT